MKNLFIFIFNFACIGLINSNADAALGLPESTARIGYSAGVARLDVNDPQGTTQSIYTIQPLKFIYTDWGQHGNRFWFEFFFQKAKITANEKQIGQRFTHSGVNLLIQKNFLINSAVRPWFGVGVGISMAQYKKRYTVDNEGYLLNSFPDRTSGSAGALLSVVNEWQMTKDSIIGGSFLQRIPLNKAITESLLSIYFLVRY